MGRFMARDYVTIREEQRDGRAGVDGDLRRPGPAQVRAGQGDPAGRPATASSAPPGARRSRGWRCRSTTGRGCRRRSTAGEDAAFAWTIWSLDWGSPAPGEHTITSRAIDTAGQIQPAPDDPWIANKQTYWESNGQVTPAKVLVTDRDRLPSRDLNEGENHARYLVERTFPDG